MCESDIDQVTVRERIQFSHREMLKEDVIFPRSTMNLAGTPKLVSHHLCRETSGNDATYLASLANCRI